MTSRSVGATGLFAKLQVPGLVLMFIVDHGFISHELGMLESAFVSSNWKPPVNPTRIHESGIHIA